MPIKKSAEKALLYIKEALKSDKWDFIIMDEVNVAVSLNINNPNNVFQRASGGFNISVE